MIPMEREVREVNTDLDGGGGVRGRIQMRQDSSGWRQRR